MTKPTCVLSINPNPCWVQVLNANYRLLYYSFMADPNRKIIWNPNWHFCPYCGQKAEELK